MPRLYVANCTRQRHIFAYRVPDPEIEISRQRDTPYTQMIEPGGQIQIAKTLSTPQIDAIVDQHAKYGMVRADQVTSTTDICGRCYSVDKPVSLDQIQRLIARNDQFLAIKGQKMREDAAIAVHASIEQTFREQAMPGNVNSLEMSVDEETRGSRSDDVKPIAEGVQVTPFAHGRQVVKSGPNGRPPVANREDAPRGRRRRA